MIISEICGANLASLGLIKRNGQLVTNNRTICLFQCSNQEKLESKSKYRFVHMAQVQFTCKSLCPYKPAFMLFCCSDTVDLSVQIQNGQPVFNNFTTSRIVIYSVKSSSNLMSDGIYSQKHKNVTFPQPFHVFVFAAAIVVLEL